MMIIDTIFAKLTFRKEKKCKFQTFNIGDIVFRKNWTLCTLIVVDVNYALGAVALQLGDSGAIIVWPLNSIYKKE